MASKPTFSSVLTNQGFRYLWANQLLMQFAINTLNFALILWIYQLTNSNLAISALIIAFYLPALIFGILAGVYVDKSDRRKIIIVVDLLLVLCIIALVFIKNSFFLILIDAFLINTLNQFFVPAESSSMPLLLSKNKLFLANSLFSFTLYGSFMLGYTLAGPVLNLFGIDSIFYFSAGALFLGFLISQNLPKLKIARKGPIANNLIKSTLLEISETFKFISGKLNVAAALGLLASIQGVIGVMAVTIASYMERVLRIQATDASLFLMFPLGLGMLTGAVLVGKFFHKKPRRMIVIPAVIISGILIFAVGVAPAIARVFNSLDLPEYIPHLRYFFNAPSLSSTFALGAFLLGAATVGIIIPSQTILQESTPKEIRGKIFAVLAVLMNTFALFPILLAGVIADVFGVIPVFISLGIIIFCIGILALRPSLIFAERYLPYPLREFLGLSHWERDVS